MQSRSNTSDRKLHWARALLMRDIRLAIRVGGGTLIGVLFFTTVITIVPFGLGPDMKLLSVIAPGILWIGALLACLLGLDRLLQSDHDDGSLELMLMSGRPLELIILIKCLAHWLTTGLPLILATPILALFLNLDAAQLGAVLLSLLVGTPALTLIGMTGAAITVHLRRGGLLLAVLVLPLTIPILIFGVATVGAASDPLVPALTPFLALCGLSLLSLAIAPVAAAFSLRVLQH
ncbi:MAG: heme exporter protein CcmB [Rhodobacteraceae bacterium]|nr:heme exporter protein CcmB [Paracoccaceae bacterium]